MAHAAEIGMLPAGKGWLPCQYLPFKRGELTTDCLNAEVESRRVSWGKALSSCMQFLGSASKHCRRLPDETYQSLPYLSKSRASVW